MISGCGKSKQIAFWSSNCYLCAVQEKKTATRIFEQAVLSLREKQAHQRHAIPCRRSKDKAKKRANRAQLLKAKALSTEETAEKREEKG
jgi:hypothetical protein